MIKIPSPYLSPTSTVSEGKSPMQRTAVVTTGERQPGGGSTGHARPVCMGRAVEEGSGVARLLLITASVSIAWLVVITAATLVWQAVVLVFD